MSGETRSTSSWMARHLFINIIHMSRQEHLNQEIWRQKSEGLSKSCTAKGKKLGMKEELLFYSGHKLLQGSHHLSAV